MWNAMSMSTENEVRDAVIKLEAKMEVMSDSMISMASSVAKLADLRYELIGVKKDIDILEARSIKTEDKIIKTEERLSKMEKAQEKNTYVVGKIEVFWTALITGGAAFFWWFLKS